MHTYRIIVGDDGGDGHNMKDDFVFQTTHKEEVVLKGYREAVRISGVSLGGVKAKHVLCEDFDDNKVSSEVIDILTELGVDWSFSEYGIEPGKTGHLTPQDVAFLFLEMAKTQIEGFEYVQVDDPPTINNFNMGYGCYSL